jgi:Holliday junction resolvase RusA-like endonuclease
VTKWGTYYSKTYKAWLQCAHHLIPVHTSEGIAFPVVANTVIAVPRARTSKLLVPVGDGDNYEKATFDMLQKKGYLADDKWITTGHWRKRFLPYGEDGYTEIILTRETEEIDIEPDD